MDLGSFFNAMGIAKKEYCRSLEPVCKRFGLTQNELAVLLFLHNNPGRDRAADIVSCRGIAKSHVSLAVNALVHKGYLSRIFRENNRKTVHLVLCGSASPIVSEGRNAQKAFAEILLKDFSEEDARLLHRLLARMDRNIRSHLKEES